MKRDLYGLAGDLADFAFGGAEMLAERTGDDRDKMMTVCLQALEAGLTQLTPFLSDAERWMTAVDVLLEAVSVG